MTAEFAREFIVEPGAFWPSAHAASVVELDRGLLASWFAGSREGAPDASIWTAERSDAGWSDPTKIIDTPNCSDGNSVLWLDGEGHLRIWYVTMEGRGWASCPVRERRSPDHGRTWSNDSYVRQEHGWMVRNEPIRWNDLLLMPMYDERDWSAFVLISGDGGRSWAASERLRPDAGPDVDSGVGIIQPALAKLQDGRLLMFLRSTGGAVYRSHSLDGTGQHWSSPEPAPLPNPNCAVDLIRLQSGALLLVYNPTRRGRSPLRVALSYDDGATWAAWRDLENEAGEFSYPTAIQTSDGLLHTFYTWRRQTIAHASFEESWVREDSL